MTHNKCSTHMVLFRKVVDVDLDLDIVIFQQMPYDSKDFLAKLFYTKNTPAGNIIH